MKFLRPFMAVLLVAVVLLSCAACKGEQQAQTQPQITTTPTQPDETTEPSTETVPQGPAFAENVKILGTDVGGKTPQEAVELVNSVLAAYAMQALVNDSSFVITGEEVGLHVNAESIAAYAQALAEGNSRAEEPKAELDGAKLRQRIAAGTGSSVVDADISYNKSTQSFEITPDKAGVQVDTVAASKVIEPAILNLEPSASVQVEVNEMEPSVTADDPRLKTGLTKANSYLKISLTYIYAPEDVEPQSQAVTKNDIGTMISFDSNFVPYVNAGAVNNYAIEMNNKYCVRGKFETAGGVQMEVNLGPILQAVDVQALAADLKGCLEKGISGTRNAPYSERKEASEGYGADYVEVNLTAQHLYVFRNGALVVSTPIVSGCVYNDTETITGVYSIYAKTRNVTLTGPGYASPVKYWMPFSGGYGLHDADWRSNFGPEEYLYNGSHGCVNIPPSVAGQVYENVYVGMPVILYGGATTVKERPQNLTGKTSYTVTVDTQPFDLNIAALGKPELTYSSADTNVVQVSSDGKVTVVGMGTTTITVDAPEHVTSDKVTYLAGSLTITITVTEGCGAGHDMAWVTTKEPTCVAGERVGTCRRCSQTETEALPAVSEHTYGDWTQTKAPSCVAGEESHTCTVCGDTQTRSVEPVKAHDYTSGGEFCDGGCGTQNPGYVPAITPTPDNTDPDNTQQTP